MQGFKEFLAHADYTVSHSLQLDGPLIVQIPACKAERIWNRIYEHEIHPTWLWKNVISLLRWKERIRSPVQLVSFEFIHFSNRNKIRNPCFLSFPDGTGRVVSLCNYLSFRIAATIDAPWIGGFEYMGLITSFNWLSTLPATSAVLQTCKEMNAVRKTSPSLIKSWAFQHSTNMKNPHWY